MFRVTGLDTKLVQRSHKYLDPSQLSLLRAPQTGSFFSASSQANVHGMPTCVLTFLVYRWGFYESCLVWAPTTIQVKL